MAKRAAHQQAEAPAHEENPEPGHAGVGGCWRLTSAAMAPELRAYLNGENPTAACRRSPICARSEIEVTFCRSGGRRALQLGVFDNGESAAERACAGSPALGAGPAPSGRMRSMRLMADAASEPGDAYLDAAAQGMASFVDRRDADARRCAASAPEKSDAQTTRRELLHLPDEGALPAAGGAARR